MFQYAMGRALSDRLGLPLTLDISLFRLGPQEGRFDLPQFRLGEYRTCDWPLRVFRARNKIYRMLTAWGIRTFYYTDEPSGKFVAEALNVQLPCLVEGYWQHERYFASVADQLRREFQPVNEPSVRNQDCLARIRAAKAVAIHFRRGDYLTEPYASIHGTCPMEYYDAALSRMQARLGPDPALFIFSDDIEWAKINVRYPLPTTFVDWNAGQAWEDLRLMSACRGLAMANSSFSWWAGWLNPDPDKIVIAPRRWFRSPDFSNALPESPWLTAL